MPRITESVQNTGKRDTSSFKSSRSSPLELGNISPADCKLPQVPWAEWSDSDLNSENWCNNGTFRIRGSEASLRRPSLSSPFEDPQHVIFQRIPSFQVRDWKRPCEYFVKNTFTLYSEPVGCSDLMVSNQHLLRSDTMRWIISAVSILHYIAKKEQFPVEGTSQTFTPSTSKLCWEPWHHVYALCQAGGGHAHRPMLNPSGKYVVRLYYMGCWRKVTVDDRIPLDGHGKVLLPMTSSGNELWPIILSKGILKLISLTCKDDGGFVDFCVFTCLTGWVCRGIGVKRQSYDTLWGICTSSVDKYEPPEGKKESLTPLRRSPKQTPKSAVPYAPRKEVLLGVAVSSSESGDSPYTYPVLIQETNDVLAGGRKYRPGFEVWRRFRWLDWAKRHGYPDVEHVDLPFRSLRVVSFNETCGEMLVSNSKSPVTESVNAGGESAEKSSGAENSYMSIGKNAAKHKLTERNKQRKLSFSIKGKAKSTKSRFSLRSKKGKSNVQSDGNRTDKSSAPSSKRSYRKAKVEIDSERGTWRDFYKMADSMTKILILYIPSRFLYNYKVSNVKVNQVQALNYSSDAEKFSHKSSRVTVTSSPMYSARSERGKGFPPQYNAFLLYPNVFQKSRNDGLYMFLDSIDVCEIFFSLSVMSNTFRSPILSESSLHYGKTDNGASIVVEEFNWKTTEIGESVLHMSTRSSNCVSLRMEEGRHVLRVWLKSAASHYVLHCFSLSKFTVGPKQLIRDLATRDSERVVDFCWQVDSQLMNAILHFGTDEYPFALGAMYKAINASTKDAGHNYDMQEEFLKQLVKLLTELYRDEVFRQVFRAVRVMFIYPSLGTNLPEVMKRLPAVDSSGSRDSRKSRKIMKEDGIEKFPDGVVAEAAALTIQRQVKRYMIRKYKKLHDPACVGHGLIRANLDKFYKTLRHLLTRKSVAARILPKVVQSEPSCPFYRDLLETVCVYEWRGLYKNFRSQTWIPFVRFVVYCQSKDPVTWALDLICPLDNYMLLVVDNDTGAELPKLVNNVVPYQYRQNRRGFTVFAYGWSEYQMKTLPWKLQIVTSKYNPTVLIRQDTKHDGSAGKIPNLTVQELQDQYIPNSQQQICSCFIKVKRQALLSFRFGTSTESVKFLCTVLTERGDTVTSLESEGVAVIPGVVLDAKDSSSETVYILQAKLLGSWPLTEQELRAVEKSKRDAIEIHAVTSAVCNVADKIRKYAESAKRLVPKTRSTDTVSCIEKPYWYLQAVVDSPGQGVVLEKDNREWDEIERMKKGWEYDDPGRAKRGKELREKFLESYNASEFGVQFSVIVGVGDKWSAKQRRVLDLFQNYLSHDNREEYLKTKEMKDEEVKMRSEALVEFNRIYETKKKIRIEMLRRQQERVKLLKSFHMNGIRESKVGKITRSSSKNVIEGGKNILNERRRKRGIEVDVKEDTKKALKQVKSTMDTRWKKRERRVSFKMKKNAVR